MAIRYLKMALIACVALLSLFYATQNVVNLESAYQAVAYVSSLTDHDVYPASFGPALAQPAFVWASLLLIILGEYAAGLLAAKGVWDLWKARRRSVEAFQAAKTYALLGAGTACLVWFGLFAVVGGAYFQMWQTEAGRASLEGAFQFAGMSALVLIFTNMADQPVGSPESRAV